MAYAKLRHNIKRRKLGNQPNAGVVTNGEGAIAPQYSAGGVASGAMSGAGMGASFGPWGAVIGGVAGGVFGGITSGEQEAKERMAKAEEEKKRIEIEKQIKENYSQAVLATYPTHGVEGQSYYKKGGLISTYSGIGNREYMQGVTGAIVNKVASSPSYSAPHGKRSRGRRFLANGGGLPKIKSYAFGDEIEGGVYGSKKILATNDLVARGDAIAPMRSNSGAMMFGNDSTGYYTNAITEAPVVLTKPRVNREFMETGDKHFMRFPGSTTGDTAWKPVTPRSYELGMKKADGGVLVPLASNAKLAKGDTHDEDTNHDGKTGITLQGKNGADIAEVENDEVIVGNKVFSTRLGFSPVAEKLARQKGRYEKLSDTDDYFTANTGKRMVARLGGKLDRLFETQEAMKAGEDNQGYAKWGGRVPKHAGGSSIYGNPYEDSLQFEDTGGAGVSNSEANMAKKVRGQQAWNKVGQGIQSLTPYIDNIYNNNLINKTPMIPSPLLEKTIPMKTTYNIAPQLQAISDSEKAYNQDIDNNTANSAVGNAMKATYYAKGLESRNILRGQKENIETGLMNQDVAQKGAVYNRNLGKENQYNWATMQRQADIQDRRSKNVANATADLQQGVIDARTKSLDDDKLKLIGKVNSMNNDAAITQDWDRHLGYARSDASYRSFLRNAIMKFGSADNVAKYNVEFPSERITK